MFPALAGFSGSASFQFEHDFRARSSQAEARSRGKNASYLEAAQKQHQLREVGGGEFQIAEQ